MYDYQSEGHLGEGVGLVLRSDMLPTLGLFLVALMMLPRPKIASSSLTASSSDSDGLSDSLSDELSELELAPGLTTLGSSWAGLEEGAKGKLGA